MDFFQPAVRENRGVYDLFPDFIVGRSDDLMVRGKHFYAIWDEEAGLWSTDEYRVQQLVDDELRAYAEKSELTYNVKYLRSFGSNGWSQFRKFLQNISDNSHPLDENLTFADTEVKKKHYASKRLPYALKPGDHSAWDELISTLYSPEERAKIEWAIGAIVAGDSKKIQKFMVFYGPGGTGKSTVMNIIEGLFAGYTTTFEAKALASTNAAFATEVFKSNPLVAIQQDGDLSKIEDNSRLNSIVSHEDMTMNEKFKPSYTARVNAFLFMGTNLPVKISDAKSGIIRRLIDVNPTGVKIPANHYHTLMSKIQFEHGAIAHHCLMTYQEMGKNFYNGYRPVEMMFQTDVFFNFIESSFDVFKEQDGATLRQAYLMYKEFCAETGIDKVKPQYQVREELRNYFNEFHDRLTVDGVQLRSYYQGFNANKFKTPTKEPNVFSLSLEETTSIFDEEFAGQPAQGYRIGDDGAEMPRFKWENVTTTLADLDTKQLHFMKVPDNHIVIDFDLRGPDGEKDLELNLVEASKWPTTYAELSKSGNGVHLHYTYDGDVTMLAPLFKEGIEVKTLLGNSSLRRRLSFCNHIPVAVINSGLPLKEKKPVQNPHKVQSEKGLRDMVLNNLRKQYHPSTKSSMDFIKHILDEAYDAGVEYDLNDMRTKVMAFANNSTNQQLACLKVFTEIKFVGKEGAEPSPDPEPNPAAHPALYSQEGIVRATASDERLAIFDVEVYPNLFIVCWKFRGSSEIVKMINPSPKEIEQLFQLKLIGFYNRNYDNHILYGRFMGLNNHQLFELSQKLIGKERQGTFGAAYGISYGDIYEFASTKQSLKKWMIELGHHKIEMDIPWDEPVPDHLIPKIVDYCCNDVTGTEAVLDDRQADYTAREILAELSGLPFNDTTQKHTAWIIFGADRNASARFKYTDLSGMFPGYVYHFGKSSYRGEDPSEGGYVYEEPGIYEDVAVLDVASMHPTSLIEMNYFGPYTKNFKDLLDARLSIKRNDYESARKMLDGKLAPYLEDTAQAKKLSYALKIVINIVYGMTSAKFDNPFRDIRNKDNIVAKRGALFMIDLKHYVQEELGRQVVHIKTDSIKIPNATPEIIEAVRVFGAKYGYDFEHEATYEKFCLVNKAVYIAKYGWHADDEFEKDPAKKKAGTWDAVGAQFQHPYVYKTLFSNEEVTWDDLCETKQVNAGLLYLDFESVENPLNPDKKVQHIGRIGRFVPVTPESGGGLLYRIQHVDGVEKRYTATGAKGFHWMEATVADQLGHDKIELDMAYYEGLVKKAIKDIGKFGDYEKLVA